MSFANRLFLALAPCIALTLLLAGLYSVHSNSMVVHAIVSRYNAQELDTFLFNEVRRRYDLLYSNGLSRLETYVDAYQKEVVEAARLARPDWLGRFLIFGEKGNIVYIPDSMHADSDTESVWIDLVKQALQSSEPTTNGVVTWDRQNYYYRVCRFLPWKWVIILAIPEKAFAAVLNEHRTDLIWVLSGGILFLWIILFLVLHRSVTWRINALRRGLARITQFDFEEPIPISGHDEYAHLARDIETFGSRLQEHDDYVATVNTELEKKLAQRSQEKEILQRALTERLSEHSRLTRALRVSEKRYQSFVEDADDIVIELDSYSEIQYVNQRALDVFGLPPREATGLSLFEFIFHNDKQRARDELARGISRMEANIRFECRMLSMNGRIRNVQWTFHLRYGERGRVGEASGIGHDITQLRKMETRLVQSQAKYHDILAAFLDGYALATWDGIIEEVNTAFCGLTGYKEHELIGMSFHTIIPAGWLTLTKQHTSNFKQIGTTPSYENEYRRKDGQRIHVEERLYLTRIVDEDEERIWVFARDISEQYAARNRYNSILLDVEAKAQALEAANNELTQYTTAISHDLKAPLRNIRGYTELLLSDLDTPHMDKDILNNVKGLERAVTKSEHMVRDLLDFSRLGLFDIEMEAVNLNNMVASILRDHASAGNAVITFTQDIPLVVGSPTLYQRIFLNLVVNALKFNKNNPKRLNVTWHKTKNQCIAISVADNGIGIDPAYHEHIFGVFRRLHTEKEFEGTGIGLALVKKAALAMQADIEVHSELGKGSTFTILAKQAMTSS